MATTGRNAGSAIDRVRILEKAVASLADTVRRREGALTGELDDLRRELKALKVFLSRRVPEFKEQFPGIERKVR